MFGFWTLAISASTISSTNARKLVCLGSHFNFSNALGRVTPKLLGFRRTEISRAHSQHRFTGRFFHAVFFHAFAFKPELHVGVLERSGRELVNGGHLARRDDVVLPVYLAVRFSICTRRNLSRGPNLFARPSYPSTSTFGSLT